MLIKYRILDFAQEVK